MISLKNVELSEISYLHLEADFKNMNHSVKFSKLTINKNEEKPLVHYRN